MGQTGKQVTKENGQYNFIFIKQKLLNYMICILGIQKSMKTYFTKWGNDKHRILYRGNLGEEEDALVEGACSRLRKDWWCYFS